MRNLEETFLNKVVLILPHAPDYVGMRGRVIGVLDFPCSCPLVVLVIDAKGNKFPFHTAPDEVELVAPLQIEVKPVIIPGELWDNDRKHPHKREMTEADRQFLMWELDNYKG